MTGLIGGGDIKLGENSGIGCDIGFGHTDPMQTDTLGGANINSHEFNLMTRMYCLIILNEQGAVMMVSSDSGHPALANMSWVRASRPKASYCWIAPSAK